VTLGWLVLAPIMALAAAVPVAVFASSGGSPEVATIGLAAPAVESCAPGDTGLVGGFRVCHDGTGGGGGGGLVALLPLIGAVVVGGIVVLIAAFLILERRTTAKLAPAEAGEWWTCSSCGRTNVVGSPRCYACRTWQA
jgi:hypothetical protein